MKLPYQSSIVLIPLLFKSGNYEALHKLICSRVIPLETIMSCQPTMKKEQFIQLLRFYAENYGLHTHTQRLITTEHGKAVLNISDTGTYLHSVRIKDEFRGKGHSKALMLEVMFDLLQLNGLHLLECPSNMVTFYEQFGWTTKYTYGLNVHVMEL